MIKYALFHKEDGRYIGVRECPPECELVEFTREGSVTAGLTKRTVSSTLYEQMGSLLFDRFLEVGTAELNPSNELTISLKETIPNLYWTCELKKDVVTRADFLRSLDELHGLLEQIALPGARVILDRGELTQIWNGHTHVFNRSVLISGRFAGEYTHAGGPLPILSLLWLHNRFRGCFEFASDLSGVPMTLSSDNPWLNRQPVPYLVLSDMALRMGLQPPLGMGLSGAPQWYF